MTTISGAYPSYDLIDKRNQVIHLESELFRYVKEYPLDDKVFLHLGCGGRILDGFTNIDKYFEDPNVINFDIFQLPYETSNTDIIFCSHVLEHLPIRHAKLAIQEWARVLKPRTGKLFLAIPDLELIIKLLLQTNLSDEERDWFMYTLFGYQTNPANRDASVLNFPVDPGQFHTCGFTKATILRELTLNGLAIENMFNFDGWGTPSIWIEAYLVPEESQFDAA